MKDPASSLIALGHGKTAPWVDLVNSEEWNVFGVRIDHLETSRWYSHFFSQWHFSAPRGESFPTIRLRQLRQAIRASCEALATEGVIPPEDLRVLNRFMNVAGRHQLVERQNGRQNRRQSGLDIEFVSRSSGWKWILAETARSFAEYLTSGDTQRIKVCDNEFCRWVFYDTTKGRTRRWCSDRSCGNRDRVRRSRARAKS